MYPNLYYAVKDLLGLDLPIFKMFQSFGLMVAVSFLAAGYFFTIELKRKETEGLLHALDPEPIAPKSSPYLDYFSNAILGFLLGYKLVFILLNFSIFLENTQLFILSTQGSWFGGMLGAGLLFYLKWRENKKTDTATAVESRKVHPYELVGQMTTIAAVGGIIGAKIFHNLENWDDFMVDPWGALISFSGLTMYGGLIVGSASVLYFARKRGIALLPLMDACAPGLMLAYGIGRIGCHVAGDGDWGIATPFAKPAWLAFLPDWFWSYRYPHNVNEVGVAIQNCVGKYCNQLPTGVFPTPLYESVTCIALFFVLWYFRKKIMQPGALFSLYLVLNGFERFWIEKIRVNTQYHVAGIGITQAEIISTLLFALGLWGMFYFSKKKA